MSIENADPFADPLPYRPLTAVEPRRQFSAESTLSVGRNASLTLGTDSLIVLGTSPTKVDIGKDNAGTNVSRTRRP